MTGHRRVLVTPRDSNPYQSLLYRELALLGWDVRYSEGPTPSQTINVALKPFVLMLYRLRGFRILHIHWVYDFGLEWAGDRKWARMLLQGWFGLYLRTARALGYSIVWTAHNLVPHRTVFHNDIAARRDLVRQAGAVIALNETTVNDLKLLGADRIAVVPCGSYGALYPMDFTKIEARTELGIAHDEIVMLLIGKLAPYKGADHLIASMNAVRTDHRVRAVIAGECNTDAYRLHLRALCEFAEGVTLIARHLADHEMGLYLRAADFAVLPFIAVTNSSSVLLVAASGLPLILPNHTDLLGVPTTASVRYDETDPRGLARALERCTEIDEQQRDEMARCATEYGASFDWATAGAATSGIYLELIAS